MTQSHKTSIPTSTQKPAVLTDPEPASIDATVPRPLKTSLSIFTQKSVDLVDFLESSNNQPLTAKNSAIDDIITAAQRLKLCIVTPVSKEQMARRVAHQQLGKNPCPPGPAEQALNDLMRELDIGFDELQPALERENVTRATATRSDLIPAYNAAIAEIITGMEDTKALYRKTRDFSDLSALKDLAEEEGHGDFMRMVEKAIGGPAQQHYRDLLDALSEYDDPTLNQICFEEAIELSSQLRAARDAADAESGTSGYVALKWQVEGDDGFTSIVKGDGLRFETAFAAVVFYGDPVEKFFWYAMVDVVSGEPGGASLDGYVTSLDLAKAACEEFINSGISKLFLAQSKDD